MIEQILEMARQLRAEIPAGEPFTDAEAMRADAAQLLRRVAPKRHGHERYCFCHRARRRWRAVPVPDTLGGQPCK